MGSLDEFREFAESNDIPVNIYENILEIQEELIDDFAITLKLEFSDRGLKRFLIDENTYFAEQEYSVELRDILKNLLNGNFDVVGKSTFVFVGITTTINKSQRTPENTFLKISEIVQSFLAFAKIAKSEIEKHKHLEKERREREIQERILREKEEQEMIKREKERVMKTQHQENLLRLQAEEKREEMERSLKIQELERVKKFKDQEKSFVSSPTKFEGKTGSFPKILRISEANYKSHFTCALPKKFVDYTVLCSKVSKHKYEFQLIHFVEMTIKRNYGIGDYFNHRSTKNIIDPQDFWDRLSELQLEFFDMLNSLITAPRKRKLDIQSSGYAGSEDYESYDPSCYSSALR